MTHEKNMMDYQSFLQKKNLAMKPGDMLYGKSYCFDKANTHLVFLDSAPKLGDFVPTNEDGEVMEKPMNYDDWTFRTDLTWNKEGIEIFKEYQSALDRRLWKGWEIKRGELSYPNEISVLPHIQITYSNYIGQRFFKHKTYEQLITSGVKLERIQKK